MAVRPQSHRPSCAFPRGEKGPFAIEDGVSSVPNCHGVRQVGWNQIHTAKQLTKPTSTKDSGE